MDGVSRPSDITPADLAAASQARDLWLKVAARCAEFDLVLPGAPSFICQTSECPVHCCKVFAVPMGEREVVRLSRASGIAPLVLMESEDGEPLTLRGLPAGRPYLLARTNGTCNLLGGDLLCSQYLDRPHACRVYPHYVFFFDPVAAQPVRADWADMRAAVDRWAAGPTANGRDLVALLLRHKGCPGFTGPPLRPEAWTALINETFRWQYSDALGAAAP